MVEPVDEYCIQALPEFEGKKFQNVAKEGLKLDHSEAAKERKEALESEYKAMLDWLKDSALSGKVGNNFNSFSITKSRQLGEPEISKNDSRFGCNNFCRLKRPSCQIDLPHLHAPWLPAATDGLETWNVS